MNQLKKLPLKQSYAVISAQMIFFAEWIEQNLGTYMRIHKFMLVYQRKREEYRLKAVICDGMFFLVQNEVQISI
jgi:hypothetical protein